ncbi:hypothetical protein SteCoe_7908 [Stentor coeruleus]|uniref:Uncharacterized protein n=1 Tax=Stentor coeruleus TaxID=5963 RepID=A0A1R2CLE1_9CILI|nr:hypothetical protein SteCoe_7908 [Stentor coeruleus]
MSENRGYSLDRSNPTTTTSFPLDYDTSMKPEKIIKVNPLRNRLGENRGLSQDHEIPQRNLSSDKLKDMSNTASVANCIRALSQKNSLLKSENENLKSEIKKLNQELLLFKNQTVQVNDNNEIIRSYKDKCLILEQSHEIFQKKLTKCEEVTHLYEVLKAEFVLINKEFTKALEKNQQLQDENIQINEQKAYLEKEIEDLNTKISSIREDFSFRKSQSYKHFPVEEIRLKDYENNNKILENLVEKQQNEINDRRKTIESLKNTIGDLEDQVYELKRLKNKAENYANELAETNDRLLKALKKKNSCRHKALTPDIVSRYNTSRCHSRMATKINPLTEAYESNL